MSFSVYCLCDNECNVVYVGSSTNLSTRVDQHINDNKEFTRVFYLEYDTEELMLQKEKSFICKFKPDYNRKLYSGVQPNSEEVVWLELDPSLFIDKVTYRTNRKGKNPTKDIYYQIHSEVLWLRFVLSKSVKVSGNPVRVEFTASDKLLYTYIKQRFDLSNQNGVEYCETRVEIAESTGLTSKTVDRFIAKMCKHGFIKYSTNNTGNRAVYSEVVDIKENKMNKYHLTLTHQYTQCVEVYAENEEQAFHIASQSDEGINWDDTVVDYEIKEKTK